MESHRPHRLSSDYFCKLSNKIASGVCEPLEHLLYRRQVKKEMSKQYFDFSIWFVTVLNDNFHKKKNSGQTKIYKLYELTQVHISSCDMKTSTGPAHDDV
jgi:hypothetical protein